MLARRTVVRTFQSLDTPGRLEKQDTNFVREPVDGLWGWPRDFMSSWCDDFCASRSAIFSGPKWCEHYHARVEIHQKRLEPVTTSTKWRRGP